MKKRRKSTTEFKAKVALEAIKGQQPIHESAMEYDAHPSQIAQWKRPLVDGASDIFRRGKDPDAAALAEILDRAQLTCSPTQGTSLVCGFFVKSAKSSEIVLDLRMINSCDNEYLQRNEEVRKLGVLFS